MPSSAASQFWLGFRQFIPIAISITAYGLVWGVLAGQAGLSVVEVLLMCTVVYSGSAQFVALTMWAPGNLPTASIIIATAIIGLRMLLMTATVRPLFADWPLPRALAAMFLVSDEPWALTMSEVRQGRGSAFFLLGAGCGSWIAWVLGTLVGRLAGAFIDDPAKYGLDFAFAAVFIALLLGMWRGRGDLAPWLVAAAAAIVTAKLVPGNWYIIVGGLLGSLAGALIERRNVARAA